MKTKPTPKDQFDAQRAEAIQKAEELLGFLRAEVEAPTWGHVGSMSEVIAHLDLAAPHARP